MTVLHSSLELPVEAERAWRLWSDPRSWASYVEGFGHIVREEGVWPEVGALVVWESTPRGRGRVSERVRDRRTRQELVIELEEDRLTAIRRLTLERIEGGVRAAVELDYRLRGSSPLRVLLDRLFVKRALRESLERELDAFARELTNRSEASPDQTP
jgi:Polyketide cyclase / dehydrase and lipid transport